MKLESTEIGALVDSRHSDGKILQIPSVQRLINGLNSVEKTALPLETKQRLHSELPLRVPPRPIVRKGSSYPWRLRDEGDGALPATSDEKKGEFNFNNNGAVGKGKYTISKKGIDINVKMTLKRIKTAPTTSPTTVTTPTTKPAVTTAPTTKPTPATSATTPATTATTPATTATTPATTATTPTSKATANTTTPKTTDKVNPEACQGKSK